MLKANDARAISSQLHTLNRRNSLLLFVAFMLTACNGEKLSQQNDARKLQQNQATTVITEADNQSLREKATKAWLEQRLHSPAGNNAMEHYLMLRERLQTADEDVESALTELLPYALIATEQAIERSDFLEAKRFLAIIERTDSQAPAIPRLRDAIQQAQSDLVIAQQKALEDKEKEAAAAARLAELQKLQQNRVAKNNQDLQKQQQQSIAQPKPIASASQINNTPSLPEPPAQELSSVDKTAVQSQADKIDTVTKSEPLAQTIFSEQVKNAKIQKLPRASTQASSRELNALQLISGKAPEYPRELYNAQIKGMVEIQYTVGADGRVKDIQIIDSKPRGEFSRAVIASVNGWRYQAPGRDITIKRAFEFNL